MITVGVDTHKDRHYAVALDHIGQMLAELTIAATAAGYDELQRWAEQIADAREVVFGIEGAGSWGAGLCQHLQRAGHTVLEVERPRRADRRAGKSDRIDAIAAAKRVLEGESVSTPRRRGILTAIRALLIARRSAVTERPRVLNQLHALNATAPIQLRDRIGNGTGKQLERRILSMRARPSADIEERAAFAVMRDLAAHSRTLAADAKRYQRELADLIRSLDDTLLDEPGISQCRPQSCSPAIPPASGTRPPSRAATAPPRSPPPQARRSATASTAEATAKRTTRSTRSRSSAPSTNPRRAPTSTAGSGKARPSEKRSAPSSVTSPASSTTASPPS